MSKAASPFIASQIGDYFKANEVVNSIDGGTRSEQGSPAHILAQGILGAAVSYATGNDALTGGISASAGETTAPIISDFLFDTKNPDELTAEQKDTISSITSALGLGIGATTGSASDAANAAETSKVAVEDNHMGGDRNKTNEQLAEDTRKMNDGLIGKFLNKNQKYILIGTDFLPVIGDIKGVEEAEDTGDYIFAAVGLIPWGGDLLQKAHKAKKAEDKYEEAKVARNVQGMKEATQEGVDILKSQGKASEATGSQVINKIKNGQQLTLSPPVKASILRNSPGRPFSSKSLTELKPGQSLFNGRNSTKVPKQVADKLSGRSFNNFDQFREAFWKEMSSDPVVRQQFSPSSQALMKNGNAPYAIPSQSRGNRKVYELDHHKEIRDGGSVYDLDNIIIRTPNNHVNKTNNR